MASSQAGRPEVRGKFVFHHGRKVLLRGVTYGPFCPGPDGTDEDSSSEYGTRGRVAEDFAAMRRLGINLVRTYTVPPRWLLDQAHEHGLLVMVGVAWEQHVTFLDSRAIVQRIVRGVREQVRTCAHHPALLAIAVGNEIPAPIVRWHGPAAVARFIERLCRVVKREDPRVLVTYVSYPTTEYLELPFLDFLSFNVFLERRGSLESYVARLQNIAEHQPLLLTEVGLDSLRNGEGAQAETLRWQIETVFKTGCAGVCVFSWTDEWYRGGHEITDWAFGVTTRDRQPKPAAEAVRAAFAAPVLAPADAPFISVVVCSYNGARTIRECLEGVHALDYPSFEVVVIDDGSTDETAAIVAEFEDGRGFRCIHTANQGLSAARNEGMREARGEIVAYIDDDAYPDSGWLTYLALVFNSGDYVGVGGPNVQPPGDNDVAECVANAPGGPSHVLFTDTVAEHLPGCNMAFRRDALLEVGGFDARFRIAGDDVDLCWRLQDNGGVLAYSPCALVWHHRRHRVRDYLRQQRNYGRAEGMLEAKWPERYNRFGHMRWAGRLYGRGHTPLVASAARRVDHGVWGSRLFQAMYTDDPGLLWSLTQMPEWYLVVALLMALIGLAFSWTPLALALPLLAFAILVPLAQGWLGARKAKFTRAPRSRAQEVKLRVLTGVLHVLQPAVRLWGRLQMRLTPWRLHGFPSLAVPRPRTFQHWSEQWRAAHDWLKQMEFDLRRHRVLVRRGGNYDRWDLQADCGLLGGARLLTTLEEHGSGRQLLRVRAWPRVGSLALIGFALPAVLSAFACAQQAWTAAIALAVGALLVGFRTWRECSSSLRSIACEVDALGRPSSSR